MAAVFTSPTPQGLFRTTALPSQASNYTAGWWIYTGETPSGGDYETLYYYGNDPVALYSEYVWIGRVAAGGYYIDVANGGIPVPSTPSGTNPTPGLHYIAYIRTGNVHRLYMDFVLIGSVTVNISAITPTYLYLGTDTFAFLARRAAAYKEFNVALSTTQSSTESSSSALVNTGLIGNLLTATPLETDVVATTGTDWTNYNGTTFAAVTPTNFLREFATLVDPNSVTVEDPEWTGSLLWFAFTAPVGITAVAVYPWTDYATADYRPLATFDGASGGPEPVSRIVSPGTRYEIVVRDLNATDPLNGVLTLRIETSPEDALSNGDLIVNADSAGKPAVVISKDTGAIKKAFDFRGTESGDSLRGSGRILIPQSRTSGILDVYDNDFALITSLTLPDHAAGTIVRIRALADSTCWYVSSASATPFSANVYRIDQDGTITDTFGPITTFNAARAPELAASADEAVLYYAMPISGTSVEIRRWDLASNAALGTFIASLYPPYFPESIIALADGTIIIDYLETSGLIGDKIVKFSSAGITLGTYMIPPSGTSVPYIIDRINRGATDAVLYIREFAYASVLNSIANRFEIIDLDTMTQIDSFLVRENDSTDDDPTPPVDLNPIFGPDNTCPLFAWFGEDEPCVGEIVGTRTDGLPYVPMTV